MTGPVWEEPRARRELRVTGAVLLVVALLSAPPVLAREFASFGAALPRGPTAWQAPLASSRATVNGRSSAPGTRNAVVPYVMSTLVLQNNTLVPGNFFASTNSGNPIEPWGVAFDSATDQVFVANYYGGNVSIVSAVTNKIVAWVPVGYQPLYLAYDGADHEVFVINGGANTVSVISDSTDTVVATVSVGSAPIDIVYDPAQNEMFVANSASNSVSVISTTSNTVVATIPVGAAPDAMTYDSTKGEVFVGNEGSYTVSVISDSSNTVVATVNTGSGPDGLAYAPSLGEIIVANSNAGTVSFVSDATNSVLRSIYVHDQPGRVLWDPYLGDALVADPGGLTAPNYNVSVLDGASQTVTSVLSVGALPSSMAYDPQSGAIYVADLNGQVLSIVGNGTLPTISAFNAVPSSIVVGGTTTFTTSALGGIGGLTYRYTGLPVGCSSTNSASFTCTPAAPGTFTVRLYVNDSQGDSANLTTGLTVIVAGGGPTVVSVTISPSTDTLAPGSSTTLLATPTCTGGSCPSGTVYQWSVTNGLGTVVPTTGANAKFTAGQSPGTDYVFVNASFGGSTAQSNPPASMDISTSAPTLASVSLTPGSVTLGPGATQAFRASASCAGTSCPSGVAFTWSVSVSSLGTVSPSAGSTTTFTAGSSTGTLLVQVVATLNTQRAWANATVTISSSGAAGPGLSGDVPYIVGAGIVVALAVVLLFLLLRRRAHPPRAATPPTAPAWAAPPTPVPQPWSPPPPP